MREWRFLSYIVLVFFINNQNGNSDETVRNAESCHEEGFCNIQPPPCTLYVAPSTIPKAGLGVFTTIPLAPGDLVGRGDLVISLQDVLSHPRSGLTKANNPLENYNWDLRTVLLNLGVTNLDDNHSPSTRSAAFVPGLESLINSNIVLLNVAQAESTESHVMDPLAVFRGSTPYRNLSTVVTQHIPAGGELFTYYGDDWFSERDATIFQEIPLSTDVPIAEELLQDLQRSATTMIDNNVALREHWTQLLNPFPAMQRKRLQHMLPLTVDDLQVALESGIRAMHQRYAVRSLADLQETGACLNHLVPKPSTIPQGGMGAFAATFLPRGSILTTSPLLHFPNYRASLDHQIWNRHTKTYDTKKPHHRPSLPLLVNYCWGHEESTVLLCPYGTGVSYLNHAPTTPAQGNVQIRWSNRTSFPYMAKEWLETDPLSWNDVAATRSTRFAGFFDYVATRDIREGEELFLDYGNEWEIAWKRFLHSSNEDKNMNDPDAAKRLNEWQEELRTEEEQDEQPYPAGIVLRCHDSIFDSAQPSTPIAAADLWSGDQPTTRGLPCQVLERQLHPDTREITYAVRVIRPLQSPPQWVGRAGIPRAYLWFVEGNDDKTLYQPVASSSFQHAMQLPDGIIPAAWRNLEARAVANQ